MTDKKKGGEQHSEKRFEKLDEGCSLRARVTCCVKREKKKKTNRTTKNQGRGVWEGKSIPEPFGTRLAKDGIKKRTKGKRQTTHGCTRIPSASSNDRIRRIQYSKVRINIYM